MDFANDGTRGDYEYQMRRFRWMHDRDVHQDYSEVTSLSGFNKYTLVRITDYNPKMFGSGWYALFTFLTVVEFYKQYIDRYCEVQNFKVTKLVST